MGIPAVSSIPATLHENQEAAKVSKAARDFEALLIGQLLRTMGPTFSGLPGDSTEVGSDAYGFLGSEALAASLAASGGLGLGAIIQRNLLKSNANETPAAPKVHAGGGR